MMSAGPGMPATFDGQHAMGPAMYEPEMIGAIKIKDGLFIGDELASTVSSTHFALYEIFVF